MFQPFSFRPWLRKWISTSLMYGGGQGALVGIVPGIIVAIACW
jgi:hypothetical protein